MRDYESYAAARLPSLRRSAYLLCGDWDRGDDLVQKVLTELFVKWSRTSRADNLDAYVHTMLVHRFLDERRTGWARWVRLADPEESWRGQQPSRACDETATQRLDIRAALAQLPPRQRAVVVLRFLHDQSVEQTAEALGCSAGTVKSQTSRALDRLRSLLGAEPLVPVWSAR